MSNLNVPLRKQREDGLRTRKAILQEAVSLATVEGLEGLSIGGLAKALGISKSGLYAHFGSKQELQLATIDEAERIFDLEVIDPPRGRPKGSDNWSLCVTFSSITCSGTPSPVGASSPRPSSRWVPDQGG